MGLPFENADYTADEVGARKMNELTDVVLTNIQNDNVLVYNNGIWENQAQSGGSIINELNDIPGVTISGIQANQVLKYVGGVWVNSTDSDANTDTLNELTDTLLTTPFGDDEVIKYSGGKWKNGNIPIEKLSNVHISNLQDGETLRYVLANTRWENANNIDTLNELSDVSVSSNLNNHVLKYNHTDGVYKNAYLNVTDLGDTNITTLANGNTLIYNNGVWAAGNISLSNFTNGTGISVTGTSPNFTITNTAPDQVVTFNNGTGINVTGNYPTFTITNTYQETDPIYTNSDAANVTNAKIAKWDAAWGWGDHSAQNYLTQANVYGLTGLTWSGVGDNELIRRTSSTTADGAGMTLQDTTIATFPQTSYYKNVSYFGRHGLLTIPFGLNRFESTSAGYNQRIIPYYPILSSTTLVSGLYLHHLPSINDYNVRVGVNNKYPSQDFQVGTTLYVNDTNKKVGIGIADPTSQLEINGDLQIDSSVEARLKFYHSGSSAHTLSEITAEKEGTNGGDLHFYTKVNNGNVTEKLRINNIGAIGIGATPNYGTAGQFLKSNNSGSAVSWGDALTGEVAPLYVDTTNNKVGINVSSPTFEFEVGNTLYVNDTNRRIGIVNATPTTTFQVGTTLNVNLTSNRVGIGIVAPMEKLDVDSIIQITAPDATTRASLYFNHLSTPIPQDLAQITSLASGTNNGGDLQFWTADGGTRTQKITINQKGAIGIGATPDFGTAGHVLVTNGSGSAVSWTNISTATAVYAGAKVSQTGINGSIYLSSYTSLVYNGIALNTPNLFVALYDGWYNMSWSLDARSGGAAYNFRYMYLNIYKNGVLYHESIFADDLGVAADKLQGITNGGSVLIELAAADYITLQVVSDSTNFGITGYTQMNKIDTNAPSPTPTNYSTNSKIFMRLNATPQSGSATEVTINSWNTTGIISNPAGLYQSSTNIFRPPRNGYYSINFQTSLKSTTNNSVNALVKLYQTDLYGTLQLVSQSQEQESNDTAIGNTKYRFLNINIILFVYATDTLYISIQADGPFQMPASPFTNLSVHNVD